MKNMKAFKTIFVMLLIFVMGSSLMGCSKNGVSIGTGNEGGNYYSYGMTLSDKLMSEKLINMEVKQTEGSLANLTLLRGGLVDFAIVQADYGYFEELANINAQKNQSDDGQNKITSYHEVASLFDEYLQFVVRADSDIKNLDDLSGKKVSLGNKESAASNMADYLVKESGSESNRDNIIYSDLNSSLEMLKNGEIDAFFYVSAAPVSAISTFAENNNIKLLNIDDEAYSNLSYFLTGYKKNFIPAGTYKGQDEVVETISIKSMLLASDNVDKDTEEAVVEVLKNSGGDIEIASIGGAPDPNAIPVIEINQYVMLALAALVFLIGLFLKNRIKFLDHFCIPVPVVGGIVFSIIACILYATKVVEFSYDESLKNILMVLFFTTVGFQANFKEIKRGGLKLIIFLAATVALIALQNFLSIGLSSVIGVSPLLGLCTGSIPMVGGHGTSGAFGPILEGFGLSNASTVCIAAATFGLVMGSLMGGPLGTRLIKKKNLVTTAVTPENEDVVVDYEEENESYLTAALYIGAAMGLGNILSSLLSLTGFIFPAYIGSMIIAAIMRNISEVRKKTNFPISRVMSLGDIALALFLSMAMVTLKLWQLADLALPLFLLLIGQTVFMFIYARFVVFNVMGRDYDAAIMTAGICGFGMGATPNAMANMQALTNKFKPSVQAFIIVPIVGGMFVDFFNSIIITLFINGIV